ncbi:carbonyl reductase [NADPH] 1-like [Aricia agestis]|uniref:carbonyl reductase [NADPH] 1-like n=1 Tax=Aricia agestis TaxID=91739 RepID=UPI001C201725|nr:carbonyl reductase [NADPH] 1-like [Aricia agestis]
MADKVAVVTGSNKGIGFGIVRKLCQRGVGVVYLTSRDIERGTQAVNKLKEEGLKPAFHQLDVTNKESVRKFAEHLKSKHGGIDILINNAAVISSEAETTSYDDAKYVIDVNYRSQFNVMEYLFPLLKNNARVVNISSDCGHIANIKNKLWIKRLTRDDLKVQEIDEFVNWFLDSLKSGKLNKDDFFTLTLLSYRVSKVAVTALTQIQQREIGRNISINSIHPGFVKTDMTSNYGHLSVDEASEAPVYLALDCDQNLKGKYIWFDKSEVDWTDVSFEYFAKHQENLKLNVEKIYQNK